MAAGAPFGVTPYGTEAMHVLRAEKGYVIVGQDTDGTRDAARPRPGLDREPGEGRLRRQAVARRADTVASRSQAARRPAAGRPGVGCPRARSSSSRTPARHPVPMLGHVTSSYRSAALGRTFALALLEPAGSRDARLDGLRAAADGAPCAVRGRRPGVLRPGGERAAMAERRPLAHRARRPREARDARELPFLAQVDVRCGPTTAARPRLPARAEHRDGDVTRGRCGSGPTSGSSSARPAPRPRLVAELEARSPAPTTRRRRVREPHRDRARGRRPPRPARVGVPARPPPAAWGAGRCAQTLFGRAQVLLQELDDATRVFVRPSFADYVVDRLLAAART